MPELHEALEGFARTCRRYTVDREENAAQCRARGDVRGMDYWRGAAEAFRGIAVALSYAAAEFKPTELHEFDHTPADFVERYRENEGGLEEIAA